MLLFTSIFMVGSFFSGLVPFSIGFTSITLTFSLYQAGFFFLGIITACKLDYQKVSSNTIAFIASLIVLISYSVVLWFTKDDVWYLRTIVAACAIYVFLYISNLLCKTKLKTPLTFIGKKSMEIYILHGPVLIAGRIVLPKIISDTSLYIFILTILSIAISVLSALVINKINFAKLLLFGSVSLKSKEK